MNSEKKILNKSLDPNAFENSADELLRIKFLKLAKKCPECLLRLPKKVTYDRFLECVNHQFVRLSQTDAKKIFELFDPTGSGFVDGTVILRQAVNGSGKDGYLASVAVEEMKNTCRGNEEEKEVENEVERMGGSKRLTYHDTYNFNNNTYNTLHTNGKNDNENNKNDKKDNNYNDKLIEDNLYKTQNLNDSDELKIKKNTESTPKPSISVIKNCITKICGLNTHLIEFSFATIDKNTTKAKYVSWNTFVQLLGEGGLTRDMKEVRNLFVALGGQSGSANVQLVRTYVRVHACLYVSSAVL